jgi:hypothetical protein
LNDKWQEVEPLTNYGIEKDKYNSLNFKPIKTKGLKIIAKLQKDASAGILEWKVKK